MSVVGGAWCVAGGECVRRRALAGLSLLFAPLVTLHAQRVDDATQLLRTGKYEQAAAAFAKVPITDDDWVAAQRGLVRSLVAVGKYDEAEAAARKATLAGKG